MKKSEYNFKIYVYRLVKRFLDCLGAFFFLLLIAPWLFLIIAIVIKTDSSGPVFFIQDRSGKDNRTFRLIKFRTLIAGDYSLDKTGHYSEVTAKSPLLTRAGLFLRKTGLDEFPQFINILKSEMSVIGPRPHPGLMDRELKKKVPHYKDRTLVKPGLTGWAQVNGSRGPAADPKIMKKRLALDMYYINHQNIWLDLRILFRTIALGTEKIFRRD